MSLPMRTITLVLLVLLLGVTAHVFCMHRRGTSVILAQSFGTAHSSGTTSLQEILKAMVEDPGTLMPTKKPQAAPHAPGLPKDDEVFPRPEAADEL